MTRDEALRLLRSGPAGIVRWNAFRAKRPGQVFFTTDDGFGNADLEGAALRGAILDKTYFGGARLHAADLRDASLRDTTLDRADLSEADLSGADLRMARLNHSNLRRARLDLALLENAHMVGTDLREASLVGADLRVIQMPGTRFHGADISGIRLPSANESHYSKSLLDLATAEGVEEAVFPELAEYVHEVAVYLRGGPTHELIRDGQFFRRALAYIRFLERLYAVDDSASERAEVLFALNRAKSDPASLYSLDPYVFEKLVAEVLASFGWKVEVTARSRDSGFDIFGLSPAGRSELDSSWIIECKRYAKERRVGIKEIRELYAVKGEQRVGKAMLATTASFTRGAREFALSRYDLELIDFERLHDWIRKYRPMAEDCARNPDSHE